MQKAVVDTGQDRSKIAEKFAAIIAVIIAAGKMDLTKTWLGKILKGIAYTVLGIFVLAAVFAIVFLAVPLLWGWSGHFTLLFDQSWSMANPVEQGAIMPLSIYYTTPTEIYQEGDVVVFDDEAGQNGKDGSVKQIVEVQQSDYLVQGLNEKNTDGPFPVPKDLVEGKVIAGRRSLLPVSFWDWLSMGFTLNDNHIKERFWDIFSLRTVLASLTNPFRNHVVLTYPPQNVHRLAGKYVIEQPAQELVEIYSTNGQLLYHFEGSLHSTDQKSAVILSRWENEWTANYTKYDLTTNEIIEGVGSDGNPLPENASNKKVTLADGTTISGNLTEVVKGGSWIVSAATEHVQTSTINPGGDSVSSITISGGGEADVITEIKVGDENVETLYGSSWTHRIDHPRELVTITLSRNAQHHHSEGGINEIIVD